jgi:hypothetical protein
MFWFIFIFALFAYGICHLTYVYRQRAINSGEAKIGLFEPSICPFCRKCKRFILGTFLATVFTAFIVSYSQGTIDQWSFLTLSHTSWEIIHVVLGLIFVMTLLIYFYIHNEYVTAGLKKLLRFRAT